MQTAQALVNSLSEGQTGCLRGGIYSADNQVKISTPRVTLTSFNGERATLIGRLWIAQEAPGVTVSNLDLNGKNKTDLPSPTVNADDATFTATTSPTTTPTICFSLGSLDTYGRADRTLIEDNRIHDCGSAAGQNYDHGIYVAAADDTVIRNNVIYDNADRGIQLYPDAQGTLVTGNVIDGNGYGVIISGAGSLASADNVIENNVITNSRIRDNVESYWDNKVGTGNVVRNNCIGGGAYDDGDGGILGGGNTGFKATDNLLKAPDYANARTGDFTISDSNPCAAILRGAPKPPSNSGPSGSETAGPPAVITIDTPTTTVETDTNIAVTGKAPGATVVKIQVLRPAGWHALKKGRTAKGGKYKLKIQLDHPGRQQVKAVASGLRDSKRVGLKVKK